MEGEDPPSARPVLPQPPRGSHRGHGFLARGLRPGTRHLDPEEVRVTVKMPLDQGYRRLRQGGFPCGPAALGLHLAQPVLRRHEWLNGKPHPETRPTFLLLP
jgi:hypothetical protein